jgi:hypothetical protein
VKRDLVPITQFVLFMATDRCIAACARKDLQVELARLVSYIKLRELDCELVVLR